MRTRVGGLYYGKAQYPRQETCCVDAFEAGALEIRKWNAMGAVLETKPAAEALQPLFLEPYFNSVRRILTRD